MSSSNAQQKNLIVECEVCGELQECGTHCNVCTVALAVWQAPPPPRKKRRSVVSATPAAFLPLRKDGRPSSPSSVVDQLQEEEERRRRDQEKADRKLAKQLLRQFKRESRAEAKRSSTQATPKEKEKAAANPKPPPRYPETLQQVQQVKAAPKRWKYAADQGQASFMPNPIVDPLPAVEGIKDRQAKKPSSFLASSTGSRVAYRSPARVRRAKRRSSSKEVAAKKPPVPNLEAQKKKLTAFEYAELIAEREVAAIFDEPLVAAAPDLPTAAEEAKNRSSLLASRIANRPPPRVWRAKRISKETVAAVPPKQQQAKKSPVPNLHDDKVEEIKISKETEKMIAAILHEPPMAAAPRASPSKIGASSGASVGSTDAVIHPREKKRKRVASTAEPQRNDPLFQFVGQPRTYAQVLRKVQAAAKKPAPDAGHTGAADDERAETGPGLQDEADQQEKDDERKMPASEHPVDEEDDRKIAARDADSQDNQDAGATPAQAVDLQDVQDNRKMPAKDSECPDQITARKQQEERKMMLSATGRATLLAQDVLELVKGTPEADSIHLEAVSRDEMVLHAQRLMEYRSKLEFDQKPRRTVQIGYHYTNAKNMETIREKGLAVPGETISQQVKLTTSHGARYGKGIYVSNNPFCFQRYGDVGLLCAVLHGKTHRVDHTRLKEAPAKDVDTILGNKDPSKNACFDEIVLQSSSQCVPLLRYSKKTISPTDTDSSKNLLLWKLHEMLQVLSDKYFNHNKETKTHPVRRVPPVGWKPKPTVVMMKSLLQLPVPIYRGPRRAVSYRAASAKANEAIRAFTEHREQMKARMANRTAYTAAAASQQPPSSDPDKAASARQRALILAKQRRHAATNASAGVPPQPGTTTAVAVPQPPADLAQCRAMTQAALRAVDRSHHRALARAAHRAVASARKQSLVAAEPTQEHTAAAAPKADMLSLQADFASLSTPSGAPAARKRKWSVPFARAVARHQQPATVPPAGLPQLQSTEPSAEPRESADICKPRATKRRKTGATACDPPAPLAGLQPLAAGADVDIFSMYVPQPLPRRRKSTTRAADAIFNSAHAATAPVFGQLQQPPTGQQRQVDIFSMDAAIPQPRARCRSSTARALGLAPAATAPAAATTGRQQPPTDVGVAMFSQPRTRAASLATGARSNAAPTAAPGEPQQPPPAPKKPPRSRPI